MNKPSSFIWMVLILLIILPTPAGQFLIDLAGGLLILITIIPIILGGIGWFTLRRIQERIQTCENCGTTFINSQINCPTCGTKIKRSNDSLGNIPASAATIDINPEDID
tara:strand:+ start:507 stop:833 length:327 start_codon:yes stop_codon:yes gene_type:complete